MEPQAITFEPHGWVPNSPNFPVLIYRAALKGPDKAKGFEALFSAHGWGGLWRNGVYAFHHYHSSAHEVLGFAEGTARLTIGGPDGRDIDVRAGDAVVLPAGTGHCRLDASSDFLVIGGYPPDQHADLCRDAPSDAQQKRIGTLGVPSSDPVLGGDGGLMTLWHMGS